MRSVLISIRPKRCELIASGKKKILIQKTRPKLETPFKCYIYETKGLKDNIAYGYKTWARRGKIIGEFICSRIEEFFTLHENRGSADLAPKKWTCNLWGADKENEYLRKCCLTHDELFDYIGSYGFGYGWHISKLKIYDKPKELGEFRRPDMQVHSIKQTKRGIVFSDGWKKGELLTLPPMSWCYVEGV